jgi:hypothetical protein
MALAVLAAVSLVISPVAPAFANGIAPGATTHAAAKARIVRHAERGELAILTKQQLKQLAVRNPALFRKVVTAYRTNTVPTVTAAEKRLLTAMSSRNLESFKAGTAAAAAAAGTPWLLVAFFIFVFLAIMLYVISGGRIDILGWISEILNAGIFRVPPPPA